MSRRVVEIFWTGGFDSTFRVVQLSRCEVSVQPYYLADGRRSEKKELTAIRNITERLNEREGTRAEILPVIVVSMEERIENAEITDAYKRITASGRHLGSQYDWLGRFAQEHPGIEIGIHQQAVEFINDYGRLKKSTDPVTGTFWELDREHTDGDVCLLFQNMHIPLVELSKLKMKEEYIKGGV